MDAISFSTGAMAEGSIVSAAFLRQAHRNNWQKHQVHSHLHIDFEFLKLLVGQAPVLVIKEEGTLLTFHLQRPSFDLV